MTPTQVQRALVRGPRRYGAAMFVSYVCAAAAIVTLLLATVDWPPRALADPMGTSGVQ